MHGIQELYKTYKQEVFQYLISLTHDPGLSEDLVSETFLSAIKSLHKFRGDSDIKTWLFSIARYKWYGHLRKKKDEVSFDHLATKYLAEETNLEWTMITGETAARILTLLNQESPRTRDIVLMRIEGYSFYEIASKHNVSESSARVIDFRAKKKIRGVLEKEGFKDE